MAHFAKLNENNLVTEVIVVANGDLLDENGNESEQKGIEFCQSLFGENTQWVQTSYNANFRSRFASPGMTYDVERDVFVMPQPYPSWTYNEENNDWEPPIPMPEITEQYYWIWNEENTRWQPVYLEPKKIPKSPFESWIWNGTEWEAPSPYPTTGYSYIWNESTKRWNKV